VGERLERIVNHWVNSSTRCLPPRFAMPECEE
jgi:hypothetical protein